jgi:hydrogenase maturation protease
MAGFSLRHVIGVGNPWAGDDGVGPEAVRRLQAEWPGSDQAPAQFLTVRQPDLALLDLFGPDGVVIIVDAVVSGASPGTLHRVEWHAGLLAAKGVERASSHGFGVRELLEMAAALGKLPARVILWGVEAASTAPEEGLSPGVAAALPSLVEELRREVAKWP